ncbi:MAG: PIN domain nuclease [Candidatus Aminicenantes bacterium]|nr:PIN domain nuclease [Candidatus Aminicenantes bacterium]
MILVDTSVLIDYLKGTENPAAQAFHSILEKKIPYGIHDVIYLEVLQGSKTEKDFKELKTYLETQTFYDVRNGHESYAEAAQMFMALKKKGVTVRSTVDCLIALVAMENDLFLLHNDEDFARISDHFPLKIWKTGLE